ncbi:vasodilator-stimulated phosphoprotein-like [Hirundo rustica]|uniref:vasodilator-stimulated phosphoprotein-like n=1 Tax=Hirundo rustica TaxID=43150 RepID=UPI002673141D|nr:vasodilator-stimulated phosphoprotein-like [Hirundo rustica]
MGTWNRDREPGTGVPGPLPVTAAVTGRGGAGWAGPAHGGRGLSPGPAGPAPAATGRARTGRGRQHERAGAVQRPGRGAALRGGAEAVGAGGGPPQSPSCVQLFHQPGTTCFRLVGRRLHPEQQVVLNCPLGRGLRYSQATPQFHQWREGRRVWGLSFAAPAEAAQFAAAVLRALQALEQGTPWPELDGSAPEQLEQPDRPVMDESERRAGE